MFTTRNTEKRQKIGFSLLVGWCAQDFYDEEIYELEEINDEIEDELAFDPQHHK